MIRTIRNIDKNELLIYTLLNFTIIGERASERDTYRGSTIENRGCLFVCLYIYAWTYVCHFVL